MFLPINFLLAHFVHISAWSFSNTDSWHFSFITLLWLMTVGTNKCQVRDIIHAFSPCPILYSLSHFLLLVPFILHPCPILYYLSNYILIVPFIIYTLPHSFSNPCPILYYVSHYPLRVSLYSLHDQLSSNN